MNAGKIMELDNQQRSPDEGNVHRLSREGVQIGIDYSSLEKADVANYTIYILKEADGITVRYVGITKYHIQRRLKEHLANAKYTKKKTYRDIWVLSLLKKNEKPIIEAIDFCTCTYIEGIWLENYYMEYFKHLGAKLTNLTMSYFVSSPKLKDRSRFFKKVVCLTKDGKFIKVFDSVKEASIFAGVVLPHVTNVLKKRKQSAGGYMFEYLENYDENKIYKYVPYLGENSPMKNPDINKKAHAIKNKNHNSVLMLDINTKETLLEFETARHAARYITNNSEGGSNILRACYNPERTAYGYSWKFATKI